MISALSSGLISSRQTGMSVPLTEMPDFKLRTIATIEPQKTTAEDMKAAWLAAHPVISPAEAFASSAELGPPTGSGRADNQTKNIHTEIKVNGKVIARVYNTGGVEIADEYRFLSDEIDFAGDKMVGPDLAEDRANRIKAVLQRYGAVMNDEQDPVGMLTAAVTKAPILELLKADTALTQDAWLEEKAKQGPLDPGSFFSRSA
jgi:hypothetical protein